MAHIRIPLCLLRAFSVLLCLCSCDRSGNRHDAGWYATRHGSCDSPVRISAPRVLASLDLSTNEPAWLNKSVATEQAQSIANVLDTHRVELSSCIDEGESTQLLAERAGDGIALRSACGPASHETIACVGRAIAGLAPLDTGFVMHLERSQGIQTPLPLSQVAKIKEVIDRHTNELRTCYIDAQQVWSQLRDGTVVIELMLSPSGQVESSRAIKNTTGSAELVCCLNSKITQWVLPRLDGCGLQPISFPIMFVP